MNTHFLTGAILIGTLVFAGCSTVESRVASHRAEVEAWPADVQQKVRAGKVDIGFTPEMVRVALGNPSRVSTRTTQQGSSDVWVYFDNSPQFSFGVGFGTVGRRSGYSGSVAVGGNDGFYAEEVMRVIFEGGRVSAVEVRK